MMIDARIPVQFLDGLPEFDGVPEAGHADQLLILPQGARSSGREPPGWAAVLLLPGTTGFQASALHTSGCSCCSRHTPQAIALTGMFQARAKGEIGFFHSVVAHLPAPDAARLRAILVSDTLVSGLFVQAG
jgi:hypothetical protein